MHEKLEKQINKFQDLSHTKSEFDRHSFLHSINIDALSHTASTSFSFEYPR